MIQAGQGRALPEGLDSFLAGQGAGLDLRSLVLDATRDDLLCARIQGCDGRQLCAVRSHGSHWAWLGVEDDPGFPFIRRGQMRESLAELLADVLDVLRDVDVVAHRAGRRAVLRVRGERDGREWTTYVKLLRRTGYRRVRAASRSCAEAGLGDLFALPICEDDTRCALVFDAVSGKSVHELGACAPPRDRQVASALNRLAAVGAEQSGRLPRRDGLTAAEDAIKMLTRGARYHPGLNEVADRVGGLPVEPCGCPAGLLHGDLHDKQIIVGEQGVRLIDLDTLACGPSCIDRANLRVHCWLRVAQGWWPAAAADRIAAEASPDRCCPNTAYLESITRARLIGVYAHRPSYWPLVDHWIAEFAARERRTA